jgi:dTMP kinase
MASAGPERPPGRLITIEGVEGAGKSTQVELLRRWLAARGRPVVATAEPDGTPVGAAIRALLGTASPSPGTEAFLFAASRAEHVATVIRPALARGADVVSDRFADSTVAYQGHGRGVPLEVIAELNRLACGDLRPALTIVLDLDVAAGLRRVAARRGHAGPGGVADPFERLAVEFHERVRKGYWAIRDREPDRVVLVDADRPPPLVAADVAAVVAQRLGLDAP